MSDRTYTEREIQRLIERAAELQAQEHDPGGPGLTLAELESVATEAGIDARYVRAAVAEQRAGAAVQSKGGADTTHIYVERVVPGDLAEEAWEDVVMTLRNRFDTSLGATMGMPGYGQSSTEQIGRSREWRHTSMSGVETRVMVRPRDGQIHLRLSQRVGLASPPTEAFWYGILAGLLGFIPGLILTPGAWVFLWWAGAALLFMPLVYTLDTRWRDKKHRELKALADDVSRMVSDPDAADIAETLREDAAFDGGNELHDREGPHLDLDALPDAPSESAGAGPREAARRRSQSG